MIRTNQSNFKSGAFRVGRVSLFLLDADVEGNPDWTRNVSSRLYGGDQEHRLRQEKILGIGGVRALSAMEIGRCTGTATKATPAFTSSSAPGIGSNRG